ncbi:MAG: SLATT domain-containing protein [Nitrospiraceae bacterium]|nr:MAG: SLATT domain-containing protein [Nitrospiraceae bacterium]
MNNNKIENLIAECNQIQEDSNYTAETHYIIEKKLSRKAFWYKFVPPAITVLSAFALILGMPNWISWVTIFSGIVSILNILLEHDKKSKDHLFAAKNFTVLIHEARSLHETFKDFYSEEEFYHNVKRLREKYNLIVQFSPSTDTKSFEEARKRIQAGIHKADFRSEVK